MGCVSGSTTGRFAPAIYIGLKIQRGLESSRTLILAILKSYFASQWGTLEHQTMLFRDPTDSPPQLRSQF